MSVNKNDTKFFFFSSTPKIAKLRLTVITVGIIVFLSIVISNPKLNTNAQLQQQDQSNINAANVYQTQTMVLGNNIKNLVILIPNEAHEPPNLKPKELRVVNQPYLPENVVVNVGTTVTWFNADVKHPHKITLVDSKSKNIVFESDTFEYFTASKPTKFNNTTTTSAIAAATTTNNNNIDTITTLMVPANLLDKVTSELKDQGFGT